MKKWRCQVCGYIHHDENIPEHCPVCGADQDNFVKISGASDTPLTKKAGKDAEKRKWRCEVCGYIHTGAAPPATCPVCGADRSMFILLPDEKNEITPEGLAVAGERVKTGIESKAGPPRTDPVPKSSRFSYRFATVTTMMARLHVHPISVHIPNGVLPVAFFFLVLGIIFENDGLLTASYYNLCFVLISMPVILFSGYNDWKIRLGGHMTRTIRIKIICGGVVTTLSFVLVIWRLVQPHVLEPWSPGRLIYLLVFLVVLLAAAMAGFFGGKLIRFPGDDSLEN